MNHSLLLDDIASIARIRFYNEDKKKFSPWKNIDKSYIHGYDIVIPLNRGGSLKVYLKPNFLPEERRIKIFNQMKECNLYRQYKAQGNLYDEPRLHVLLASTKGLDYKYHGTNMKSFPLNSVTEVEMLHNDLASIYNLPNKYWNLGVDLMMYRNGNDSIGFHADDTQGEELILCLIIDSNFEKRKIKIRPNKKSPLKNSDEEIELYLGQGNGYEMDGKNIQCIFSQNKIRTINRIKYLLAK